MSKILERANDPFEIGLQSWVYGDPAISAIERDSRITAMQRMIDARRSKSTFLDLSSLHLSSLPSQIGDLVNLDMLNLANNKLTTLPPEIGNLTALMYLNLRDNKLTTLPPKIGNPTNLEILDLSYNQLTTIPYSLLAGRPRDYAKRYVNLGYNLIPPAEVQILSNLALENGVHLEISIHDHTQPTTPQAEALTAMVRANDPFEIGLQSWVYGDPAISAIERDSRITAMQRMIDARRSKSTFLDLSSLHLSSLPSQIGDLVNLDMLNLANNKLTTLPPEIGNLTALMYLNLHDNKLTTLPPKIGNPTNLEILDLSYNQLTTIPYSLLAGRPRDYAKRYVNLGYNLIPPAEVQILSNLALENGVHLEISIHDHTQPTTPQAEALTAMVIDKILATSSNKKELDAFFGSPGLEYFKIFLGQCPRTEGWKSQEAEMIGCLLEIANKMSQSEAVKIKCETLAETAMISCEDGVGLAFVQMQLALNLSDKELKDMSPQEVYDYAKQESVIKFLSEKAKAKIAKIKTTGGALDEIETHLAYLQIGQELGLNLKANGMFYQGSSNVEDRDLESAKQEFLELDCDREFKIAKHIYEDEIPRTDTFVNEIIERVGAREEFDTCEEKENGEFVLKSWKTEDEIPRTDTFVNEIIERVGAREEFDTCEEKENGEFVLKSWKTEDEIPRTDTFVNEIIERVGAREEFDTCEEKENGEFVLKSWKTIEDLTPAIAKTTILEIQKAIQGELTNSSADSTEKAASQQAPDTRVTLLAASRTDARDLEDFGPNHTPEQLQHLEKPTLPPLPPLHVLKAAGGGADSFNPELTLKQIINNIKETKTGEEEKEKLPMVPQTSQQLERAVLSPPATTTIPRNERRMEAGVPVAPKGGGRNIL